MSTWEVLLVYDTHNLPVFVYGSGDEEAGEVCLLCPRRGSKRRGRLTEALPINSVFPGHLCSQSRVRAIYQSNWGKMRRM